MALRDCEGENVAVGVLDELRVSLSLGLGDTDAVADKLAVEVRLGVPVVDGLCVWLRESVRLSVCVSEGLCVNDAVELCDGERERLGVWLVLDVRAPLGDRVWLGEVACEFVEVPEVLELWVWLELPV